MSIKDKAIIEDFLKQILDLYEFEIWIDINKEGDKIFRLNDLQGANWSYIEQEEFSTLADIVERLGSPHEDYIYRSLEEREDAKEIIPRNDWDLTVKRYLESNTIAKILNEIIPDEYVNLKNEGKYFEAKQIIKILDEDEKFYKSVCTKYVNTMSKEMIIENDNDKILHIFIEDEFIKLKDAGKINNLNYKEYLDPNFEVYEYRFYQELYQYTVKDNIAYDLNDLELFDENGKWEFYITFEELKKVGYGFMVKDQFPLIEKYAVSEDKIFDFFEHFSLDQLEDFERSLDYYFNEKSIVYNQDSELEFVGKEDYSFNKEILKLACGLITYEDFIADYSDSIEEDFNYKIDAKVESYFNKNNIENLMEYGCDSDEGLYHLTDLYSEIMDDLNIKYDSIYTENGPADGKYLTVVTLTDGSIINLGTRANNGVEIVADNIKDVYEIYEKLQHQSCEKEVENNYEYE